MTELQIVEKQLAAQERIFKLADFLSRSTLIPKHFQGQPSNVFIALKMSDRLNVDFFELANGLYIVHGTPAFSGTFIIGRINASGLFKTRMNFKTEGTGDKMQVTAYAKDHDDNLCTATVGMSMAKAEGWIKNSKYQTMPEQMLTYRSATFFCRKHCPEVLLGTKSVDEVEDIKAANSIPVTPFNQTVEAPQIESKIVENRNPELDSLIEEAENLTKQAIEFGIDTMALSKVNPDLSDPEQVINAISMLKTMIRAKLKEIKESHEN